MRITVLHILNDLGILVDDLDCDFDLSEYFVDSIIFISFIVALEEYIQVELPEEFLLFESYCSFYAVCDALEILMNNTRKVQ